VLNRGGKLSEQEQGLLDKLAAEMNVAIQTFAKTGAFVRLSTRSPKDAVDKAPIQAKLIPHLRKHLQGISDGNPMDKLNDVEKLTALRRAFFDTMRVENATEAMELVMYSSRTVSDLVRALDHLDKVSWNMKIIIREFTPMPLHGEYRGFVHNKKLTAVSQYYSDSFFPHLPKISEEVLKRIAEYYDKAANPLINLDSYIIDFVVFDDMSIKIVELNPFSRTTGPCLFDWQADKDLLENGPLSMRVVQSPSKNADAAVMPWTGVLNAAMKSPTSQQKGKDGPCSIS